MKPTQSAFSWLLHKIIFAALLIVFGFVGAGLWVFNHEPAGFLPAHRQAVQALTTENLKLKAAVTDANNRLLSGRTEVAARQLRADQAAKVARELDDLNSGFARLTTNSDQVEENDRRLARMKQMEADSRKRVTELSQELVRIQWEKDGMEIALERNQAELKTATAENSALEHYARRVWTSYGKGIFAGVALIMLAPVFWRLFRAWRRS